MFAQKVLTQEYWDTTAALKKMMKEVYSSPPPKLVYESDMVRMEQFVDFPNFKAHRVLLEPGGSFHQKLKGGYHLLIAVTGDTIVDGKGFQEKISPSEAMFMPAAALEYLLINAGNQTLILLSAQPV